MSLLDDVSIVVTPNGYKAGELYAVIPVPTEGADLINDGDFPLPNTEWTIGGGAEITVDGARINNTVITGNAYVIQSISGTVIGKQFVLTYDVIATNGEDLVIEGGITRYLNTSTTGTNRKLYYTWDRTNNQLVIKRLVANTDVTIDNVILQELTSADMDVTRATAATRVDENGLVNYAEVLGGEEVTDGNFPTPNTEWTAFGLATINENIVNFVDAGSNTYSGITQDINSFSAKQYKVEITVTNWISGDILATFSSNTKSFNITGNGTYSVYLTPVSNGNDIGLVRNYSSGANFSYSITNVSVKEVTRDNVPRIDYTGGGCPHILAEPQRRNTLTYSEDFTDSSWIKLRNGTGLDPVITSNYTTSPDGTNNASRVVFDAGTVSATNFSMLRTNATGLTNPHDSSISIYLKSNTASSYTLIWYNESLGSEEIIVTPTWARYTLSTTSIASTSDRLHFGLWDFNGAVSSNNADVSVWGAQLEEGSYATSYIPTSGSTVTRNQDIFTRDGIGNLINSTEGVLFVEMAALSNDGTFRQLTLSDGTTANRILVDFTDASNQIRVFCGSGGVSQVSETFNVTSSLSFNKIAFKYKLNDFALWVNGVEVATDTSGITPIGLNKLSFNNGAGSFDFYGKVRQLQVYDTALTDDTLALLTS